MSDIVPVVIPPGLSPGSSIAVVHNGCQVVITVPEGVSPGDTIQVSVPNQTENVQIAQAVPVTPTVAVAQAVGVSTGGVHAIAINGTAQQAQAPDNSDLQYAEKVLRARSWISCWALIDMMLIILSLYQIGVWGLVLLIGPIFGYYGARTLNPKNVIIYYMFKVVQTVVYFFQMIAAETSEDFVWGLLLVLCELYITYQVDQFYKILVKIDQGALERAMSQIQNQAGNSYY